MKLSNFIIPGNISHLLLLMSLLSTSTYTFATMPSENSGTNNNFMDQKTLYSLITSAKTDINASSKSTTLTAKSGFINAISDKLIHNIDVPATSQGSTTRLYLKLDKKGNVLSSKAHGSNTNANQAAEKAAYAASPLPIDLDNPKDFTDLVIKIISK